jgi:hypothetical protein
MKSLTIVSDDKVGLLADISYILGKSNINIDGLFVDVIGGKAVISIEVKDPKLASPILANNGFNLANPESIVVKVSNNSMEKLTEMLEFEDISILDLSMLSSDKEDGVFAIRVDKPRKAYKILSPFLLIQNPSYY